MGLERNCYGLLKNVWVLRFTYICVCVCVEAIYIKKFKEYITIDVLEILHLSIRSPVQGSGSENISGVNKTKKCFAQST